MPKMRPSSCARRQCPPLRSVLLMTTSNAAMRRNASLVLFEQREVVLLGVVLDESLHHPEAVRGRRAAPCRARCPSPAPPTPRTPRPRDGRATPAGNPTADARPAAACRSRASRRRRRRDGRGTSRSTTTACARATSTSPSRSTSAARASFDRRDVLSSSAGRCARRDPSGSRTSGHLGRPASTAATPLRAIARTWARVA